MKEGYVLELEIKLNEAQFDRDTYKAENEELKARLSRLEKRLDHYVDQNMGLINAVAVLGNRVGP